MAKKQIGEVDYNVEFNDSVLSTQTWNNSRYNGSKTETQVLNKYTAGDTTYGTKTAIQKYTRNIYVGDYIAACSGSDDPNLVPFPGFSYLMTTKYITVNEDDTVDEKRFRAGVPDEKVGFYRSFLEDFTPGTQCQVYLLNEGVNNSLDDGYNVYFADGRLKQVATYQNSGLVGVGFENTRKIYPLYNQIQGIGSSGNIFGTFNIKNNTETRQTYSGSVGVSLTGDVSASVFEFLDSVSDKLTNTDFRYFGTAKEGNDGEIHQIIPIYSRINNEGIKTVELMGYNRDGAGGPDLPSFNYSSKYTLEDLGNIIGTQASGSSYEISKLNDNIPSILVNLPKDEHLPNGLVPGNYIGGNFVADPSALQGPKFVVIPENIHPFIKDNIKYFLIKAGLMAENQNLTINTQNRQLL